MIVGAAKQLQFWIAVLGTALLTNLAFSPFRLGFLAFVCFVPLLVGLTWRTRRRFLAGWLAGFTTQLAGYYWIFYTIRDFGGQGIWVSTLGTALFCLYQGLDMGLWMALAPRLFAKGPPIVRALGFGACWYLIQVWVFPYVFPWSLGASQTWSLATMKTSILWSQNGIGFFVVTLQVLGYLAWKERRHRRAAVWSALIVVAVFLAPVAIPGSPIGSRLQIAVVQPNLIPWAKNEQLSAEALFRAHARPTQALEAYDVDLVLWPEAALAFPLNWYPGIQQELHHLARDLDAPLIIGTLEVDADRHWYNAIWMCLPDADRPQTYHKERLVLFSEQLPLILRWARFFDPALGGYVPGDHNHTFSFGSYQLVPLVCFEAVLPDYARKRSGHLFVNLTNDAWFGRSKASGLHLQHLQMRAVECQIPLVRATNSGISCWIDTCGNIHDPTSLYTSDVRRYDVGISERPSLRLSRFGDRGIGVFSLFWVVWGILRDIWKPRFRTSPSKEEA